MRSARMLLALSGFIFLLSSPVLAQFPVIGADEVQKWMSGRKKVLVIDVRLPDEYEAGHISGAVNIPAEQMNKDTARLPKDKAMPIIFYCRGAG